jgi:hypothetical protein
VAWVGGVLELVCEVAVRMMAAIRAVSEEGGVEGDEGAVRLAEEVLRRVTREGRTALAFLLHLPLDEEDVGAAIKEVVESLEKVVSVSSATINSNETDDDDDDDHPTTQQELCALLHIARLALLSRPSTTSYPSPSMQVDLPITPVTAGLLNALRKGVERLLIPSLISSSSHSGFSTSAAAAVFRLCDTLLSSPAPPTLIPAIVKILLIALLSIKEKSKRNAVKGAALDVLSVGERDEARARLEALAPVDNPAEKGRIRPVSKRPRQRSPQPTASLRNPHHASSSNSPSAHTSSVIAVPSRLTLATPLHLSADASSSFTLPSSTSIQQNLSSHTLPTHTVIGKGKRRAAVIDLCSPSPPPPPANRFSELERDDELDLLASFKSPPPRRRSYALPQYSREQQLSTRPRLSPSPSPTLSAASSSSSRTYCPSSSSTSSSADTGSRRRTEWERRSESSRSSPPSEGSASPAASSKHREGSEASEAEREDAEEYGSRTVELEDAEESEPSEEDEDEFDLSFSFSRGTPPLPPKAVSMSRSISLPSFPASSSSRTALLARQKRAAASASPPKRVRKKQRREEWEEEDELAL